MKKILFMIIITFVVVINVFPQGSSGSNAKFEYRYLIDMPAAGILQKGFSAVTLELMPFGVVIPKIEVGVFDGVSFGISYGGSNVIGTGKMEWYKWPGINIRARIINEEMMLPAITVGFNSQGKGLYDKVLSRFEIKSPGFFVTASKNFDLLGYFSVHGALNYSLEREDADKDLNLQIGFEKTIGSNLSFIGEYDFAVNDNTGNSFGKGNGYMNFGLRFSLQDGLTIGVNFRDMLKNRKAVGNVADRGVFVEYIKGLF
jgi:hypothetical protein